MSEQENFNLDDVVSGEKKIQYVDKLELLRENGVNESKGGVAVALNGEVVPRGEWYQTALKPMDKVEIVHIVRGG